MKHCLLLSATLLVGCAAFTEHRVGTADGRLLPCGDWPRCVSSVDTGDKAIEPIALTAPAAELWPAIRATVRLAERTRIVDEAPGYLRAEIDSPWGWYVDDLELMVRERQRLDVRSTGRIGYYDFEVNRERVEALRARLIERGLAQP